MKLKNYHNEIIGRLSKLKERWTNCKDPEDIEEAPEEAQAFSCPEKEQWHKNGICYDDTEYMSFFKISKKQHQLVTNIKHAADGIQLKSLKRVLDDIEHLNIQPYVAFEEEERKRLHEHWSQLANKDIPDRFENLKEHRLLVDKWRKSVPHVLTGMKQWVDKKGEKVDLRSSSPEHVDERDSEEGSACNVQDEGCVQSVHHFAHSHHREIISSPNSCQELNPLSQDEEKEFDILKSTSNHTIHPPNNDYDLEKIPSLNSRQEHKSSVDEECGNTVERATTSPALPKIDGCEDSDEDIMELEASPSTDGHFQERIPSLGSHKRLCPVGEDEGEEDRIRSMDGAPVVWQFLERINDVGDAEANAKYSASRSRDIWQQRSIEHPYHHPTSESQAYTSIAELPFQKPQAMEERAAQLVGLETRMHAEEGAESVALHVDSRLGMVSSFANQDRNLLPSPFHKELGTSPSFVQGNLDRLNKSEIHFAVSNDSLTQSSRFPPQFWEQREMLLAQNHSREKDLYMHQGVSMNMLSGGRYPNQDHFPSGVSQDWPSLQSPMNGGLLGQNWSHGDNCTGAAWSGAESGASLGQCFGVTSSIDGSLFGVLSQCNKLLPSSPYVTVSSERSFPCANVGSGGSPHGDGIYTYPPLLNNSSSRDSAAKMNSMPGMNFSHQYPGLPESLARLPSWNQ